MVFRSLRNALLGASVATALVLAAPAPRAHGQILHRSPAPSCPDVFSPGTTPPGSVTPPDRTTIPPSAPDFAEGSSMIARGESAFEAPATGYIDPAMPLTLFRFRFDAAYNNNRPDRAEFFYGKCGCFRAVPVALGGDPKAPGPPLPETRVDYQDLTGYLEVAFGKRLSGFIEAPYRFLNPEQNANTNGFSDINAGFKFAFVAQEDLFLTFQFRGYFPTGDAGRGLGTDHVSLEPGLLGHAQLTNRLALDAELRDWIPVDGTDFAGNVLRYGVGVSYAALDRPGLRVAPVAEFVGWTVLNGKEFDDTTGSVFDAAGNTIVNVKLGARTYFGASDIYVGWGHALTGARWYRDLLRVEYRLKF